MVGAELGEEAKCCHLFGVFALPSANGSNEQITAKVPKRCQWG